MLNNRKLVADTMCEVYDLIKDYTDEFFWDFAAHELVPGATYIIGRRQFLKNAEAIRDLIEQNTIRVILSNPHEGSTTIMGLCKQLRIVDWVKQGRVLLIGGGDIEPGWQHLQYDSFLPKLLDYEENRVCASRMDEIYHSDNKPYKFLFLNGRSRNHRKYLIERFMMNGVLDQSLWTNLDNNPGPPHSMYRIIENNQDRMTIPRPFQYLPAEYEVDRYLPQLDKDVGIHYAKYTLFDNEWGEIYLKMEPYRDTYFSLVTETVFEHPWSFRTEKIWKPICIGHPWIAVASVGYYKEMHGLGFKTFGHLIDESFDQIDNYVDRANRIIDITQDLCYNGAKEFMLAAKETCKYNQAHLAEMSNRVRAEFPNRFKQFIHEHQFDE